MQWFYGPTWGRTLKVCEKLLPHQRRAGCATQADLRNRQLELIEVLRRNVVHPAVAEVHVLVGEAEPILRFLRRLPWYERLGCKLNLVATGTRPRFRDYVEQVAGPLRGRTVVFTNQDVLLSEGEWASLPAALPPRSAFFLSRYHSRYQYDVQYSTAAGVSEGLFNATRSFSLQLLGRGKRVCDMTSNRFGMWRRSLCSPANFGSYDAYVLRVERPLSEAELELFNYPQNAWGGENLFLFLVTHALGMTASNPCLSLKATHVHCELPTEFGVLKVGDRRLGKREIIEKALSRLRALGRASSATHQTIGAMALNVTRLPRLAGAAQH